MLTTLYPWLKNLIAVLAIGLSVGMSWSWYHKREHLHRALMVIAALIGFWAYTDFGAMHDHGNRGHQDFHAHDFSHYYLGSKYIKEWGYYGMYVTEVKALEEIGQEVPARSIKFTRIRDLRGAVVYTNDRAEIEALGREYRSHFSDARWNELKTDLRFLRELAPNNDWWFKLVLDAGFNPPPTYAVVTSAVSNVLPLNESTWTKLGALDLVLLGVSALAIGWAFGPVPGLFVFVVLGTTPIRTFPWTGGSFLRHVWVMCLLVGLSFLAKRKHVWGGAFLAASSAAVLFPALFLFGGLVPLAYRAYRYRQPRYLIRAMTGAAAAAVLLGSLSLVAYGPQPWHEWRQRISVHDAGYFANHLGLKKLTSFVPEVTGHDFGGVDALFPDWNKALAERTQRTRYPDLMLAVVLSGILIVSTLRAKPAEAALLVGSGLLGIWTMPAGYYTIYMGGHAAFLLAGRNSWHGRMRFSVFAAMLYLAAVVHRLTGDLLIQSVALSVLWLTCLLVLAAFYWLEKPPVKWEVRRVRQTVLIAGISLGCYVLSACVTRGAVQSGAFLPSTELKGGKIADLVNIGDPASEQSHAFQMGEDQRVPRLYLDVHGYRVADECAILRQGYTATYQLNKAAGPARLIVRSDTYYGDGELQTTANGKPLAPMKLVAHRTMFDYLEVGIPADFPAGPLRIEQHVSGAPDVGLFTAWLVQ